MSGYNFIEIKKRNKTKQNPNNVTQGPKTKEFISMETRTMISSGGFGKIFALYHFSLI